MPIARMTLASATKDPTALLAPITTGGILRPTGRESVGLRLTCLLLIAYARCGVLATLGTSTIALFAVVAAISYAVLIGTCAWIGGGGLPDDVD